MRVNGNELPLILSHVIRGIELAFDALRLSVHTEVRGCTNGHVGLAARSAIRKICDDSLLQENLKYVNLETMTWSCHNSYRSSDAWSVAMAERRATSVDGARSGCFFW